MLSTSAMTLKMSIELESEAEYQYEWEGMDAYDEMLAAYAYDNEVFEWSFERVEATVCVVEHQARGVPHLHALFSHVSGTR